jgi:hypothetical protein
LLRIDIDRTRLTIAVNGTEALTLTETKATPAAGNIGLFVDIGSESLLLQPHADVEMSCAGSYRLIWRIGRAVSR